MHYDILSMKSIRENTLSVHEAAKMLDETIEAEKESLLAVGGECYPFSMVNMFEALTQVSDAKKSVVAAFFASAYADGGRNDNTNHCLYLAMKLVITEYWDDVAQKLATENIERSL